MLGVDQRDDAVQEEGRVGHLMPPQHLQGGSGAEPRVAVRVSVGPSRDAEGTCRMGYG